jgi:hypothetical protein
VASLMPEAALLHENQHKTTKTADNTPAIITVIRNQRSLCMILSLSGVVTVATATKRMVALKLPPAPKHEPDCASDQHQPSE